MITTQTDELNIAPREGIGCPRCGFGDWNLYPNWNGSQRCRCLSCHKVWMPAEWKRPRGRRHTDPFAVGIVHRLLRAGCTETAMLACAANISRWNAWNLRRKFWLAEGRGHAAS